MKPNKSESHQLIQQKPKKHSRRSIGGISLLLIAFTLFVLTITACQTANTVQPPTQTIATPLITKTNTPTRVYPTATPRGTTDWFEFANATIDFAQEPILVSTETIGDPQYIYKYTTVTFKTPVWEGRNYLNLDDLYDNTPETGDVVITHTSGSGGFFFDIAPANGATYYYSDLHGMTMEKCLEHFPFTNMDPEWYFWQGQGFASGRDYCVLTNENRLSIIRMFPDSQYESSADDQYTFLEVVVTTYSKVLTLELTPSPTETKNGELKTDRYANANLTEEQKQGLDKAAQTFIDAVNNDDRKTVLSMLDYPVSIDRETMKWLTYAENEEEFLSIYGEIFTPAVLEEFANATVEKNMGLFIGNRISLILPDLLVDFYPDGKIASFSLTSYWWENYFIQ